MSSSNTPFLTPLAGADVVAAEDRIVIDHPSGALNDERSITVAELAVAVLATQGITNNYLTALGGTAVHMRKDVGKETLTALAGGALQADANARANALKADAAIHAASVGSQSVNGAHLAADATAAATLAAIPAASTLGTCITLINGLFAWHQAHAIQSGTHFHNDTVPAGQSMTNTPPTTLAHCITNLNELVTMMQAHFARGVA